MNNYIFVSFDALSEFSSDKFFQSPEYRQGAMLCSVLKNESVEWKHATISLSRVSDNGIIFHTANIEKKKGILFDLTTFYGFANQTDSTVISVFQKVVRFAIKYYNRLPFNNNEKSIDENLSLIYPFPFVAQKEVDKVYIDKNSSKQNRADQNYLTVFYYGHNSQVRPIFTVLNKLVEDLRIGNFSLKHSNSESSITSLSVINLDDSPKEFTIDSHIGLDLWQRFLTATQLSFVTRDVKGAERLEGAAGSGKTISLILRSIYLLKNGNRNDDYHIIFLTHSLASKESVIESFRANCSDAECYLENDGIKPVRSILFTTLQEWSSNNLGTNSIEETEFLDKDAEESKVYQYLYVEQAYERVKNDKWNGYSVICSNQFKKFLETASIATIVELFRYEISVLIKGRSNSSFDLYKLIERPELCLPLFSEEDKLFAFDVFEEYQKSLEATGQFDSDDITLSALGQINTPIWKRRSLKDGYDVCFIDETQLFNLNELSVFHYLNKPSKSNHIIFAIDRSQTFGEVGFTEKELSLVFNSTIPKEQKFETIFRSSPEITDLAFNILSSNTSLFSNYDNPLEKSSYSFTTQEEIKCETPEYVLLESDKDLIDALIHESEDYHITKKIERGNILIISVDGNLTNIIEDTFKKNSKPIVRLKGKNDTKSRQNALNKHSFVLSDIDFVGGLEFDAVFIAGIDKGRVPPEEKSVSGYIRYSWHNRMYVAITRAKYCVKLYGNKHRGVSPILESALEYRLLNQR